MDAMIRRNLLLATFFICWLVSTAQQMNWTMLAEDTLYYAKDYLPDHRVVSMSGPAQVWDLRTLKAPYALSRRIIQSGEREGKAYANLVNGKQTDMIMRLTGKLTEVIQVIDLGGDVRIFCGDPLGRRYQLWAHGTGEGDQDL